MDSFTHIDDEGRVRMVDVTDKPDSLRTARARGVVTMQRDTFDKIKNQQVKKGNVLETARIAGVMAAKKTADLIPMCHPLNLSHVAVDFFRTRMQAPSSLRPRPGSQDQPVWRWKP